MSQTNLVKITAGFIHIDEPIRLRENCTLVIQCVCTKESKAEDEFSDGERNIAEVKGIIAEVRNREGKIISTEENNEN